MLADEAAAAPTVRGRLGSRRNVLRLTLAIVVSLACLAFILDRVDFDDMWRHLRQAAFGWIALAFGLILLSHLACGWRLGVFLGLRPGLTPQTFRVVSWYSFLSGALPFRLGEVAMVMMLRGVTDGCVLTRIGQVVVLRLLDLGAKIVALVSTFALVQFNLGTSPRLTVLASAGAVLATTGLIVLPFVGHRIARATLGRPWMERTRPGRWAGKVLEAFHDLDSGRAAAVVTGTILLWICLYMGFIAAAKSVLPELGLAVAGLASAAANLAFALPVSGVAAIGTFEAGWTGAARIGGVPLSASFAAAAVVHAVLLAGTALIALLAFLVNTRPAPQPIPVRVDTAR